MTHFSDLGGNGKGADLSPIRMAIRKRLVPVKGGGSTTLPSPSPPPPPPPPPPGGRALIFNVTTNNMYLPLVAL